MATTKNIGNTSPYIDHENYKTTDVIVAGHHSAGNSSQMILGAGETFTGEFEQENHPDVMVSCQTSATATMFFDFSVDGTNHSTFPIAGFEVSAWTHELHTAVKGPRWFRIRLVNDSTEQIFLRLYTYYGTFRASNTPLNQSIGLDSDGASVRPTDYQDEVSRGLRNGVTPWTKFGYRDNLTAGAGEETIWAQSGNHVIMDTASTFTITYDGTAGGTTDGTGTTGATQVYIYYIDTDGMPQIGAHGLGTDGSDVTSFSGLGINRVVVSASGTNNFNNSEITITETTGGTVQAVIPAGQSVTQQCIFFNGSNHTSVAKFLHIGMISGNKDRTCEFKGYVFNRQFMTRYEIFRSNIDTSTQLDKEYKDPIGFNLSPTDVLYFVADVSGSGVSVEVRFSLNMYANN